MQSLSNTRRLAALTIIAVLVSTLPASASKGGIERPRNTFTAGITFKFDGVDQLCSGALISPIIVVTAGHCVYDEKGNLGTNYYFTKPGVPLDAAINPNVKAIKLYKVFTKAGFKSNAPGSPDDIAFIQLDSPLATSGFIRPATAMEVSNLAADATVSGYGYGAVFETGNPYSIYPREYLVKWNKPNSVPASKIDLNSTETTACTGDSGGPITTVLPTGEEVLLAVMSRAARVENKCGTIGPDGKYTMQATVVDTYMDLIKNVVPSPAPTPSKKIIKINCYKGKAKKVVTGVNPKCPKGYVKR